MEAEKEQGCNAGPGILIRALEEPYERRGPINLLIIWLAPGVRRINQILPCDLPPKRQDCAV